MLTEIIPGKAVYPVYDSNESEKHSMLKKSAIPHPVSECRQKNYEVANPRDPNLDILKTGGDPTEIHRLHPKYPTFL